jgi:hypothetical protein
MAKFKNGSALKMVAPYERIEEEKKKKRRERRRE